MIEVLKSYSTCVEAGPFIAEPWWKNLGLSGAEQSGATKSATVAEIARVGDHYKEFADNATFRNYQTTFGPKPERIDGYHTA